MTDQSPKNNNRLQTLGTPSLTEEIAWFCAKTSFEAKRYNDCIRFFNELVKEQPRISKEQRELMANAYKRSIGPQRNALLIINEEIESYKQKANPDIVDSLTTYQKLIIDEIAKNCNHFLELIDTTLLPVVTDAQSIVFYNKLKGDYYRYLSELGYHEDDGNIGRARASYEAAMKAASEDVKMADPIYLGLILNFCVFQYEILNMGDDAIDRADASFNEAVRYLEELDEKEYVESTMLLQLLRDNIAIWREDRNDDTNHV
ncbi:14-3-3 protein [Tritrichomonas foetus]|uniref:14-3-3 protein n=1 Tax=Tritrichomonas foetus TaxID=1144522 RepID=A0A1J4KYC4_9EUKA|nr:14-3-3 protein [Tritrichomonas foetus]|eukprot:OHT15880.1 14-3-3 protein [Tritrichomonas foetus]